jgi:pimeloyl-ACP methyl ester carboxylesterase
VRKWLPQAEQVTIDGCGHVPQVERADETNELLLSFFARADAAAPDVPAGHRAGAEAA